MIRPAVAADLPGVLACLESLAPVGIITQQEVRRIFQAQMLLRCQMFVKEHWGNVVATATLTLDRHFIHNGGLVGRIEDVAVLAGFHRKGHGGDVVRDLTRRAKDAGARKVTLCCKRELVPFYQKMGFHTNGVEMRLDS